MTSYTQNQTIIQAGDPFEGFHIITEGSVAAIYDSSESIKSFTLKRGMLLEFLILGSRNILFPIKPWKAPMLSAIL